MLTLVDKLQFMNQKKAIVCLSTLKKRRKRNSFFPMQPCQSQSESSLNRRSSLQTVSLINAVSP